MKSPESKHKVFPYRLIIALLLLIVPCTRVRGGQEDKEGLIKRDVVVRVTVYSGTESLHWADGFHVPLASKPEEKLRHYVEEQVNSWGYMTEEKLRGQTSACMVVNEKCDSVGTRDFDWSKAKNVEVVFYVRYTGASSVPSSIDVDFVSSHRAGLTSDHWREHMNVHHWDKDLQRSLDGLHKRMDSGK